MPDLVLQNTGPDKHDNIISLSSRRHRKNKPSPSGPTQPPMINLPPATKWLAFVIIGIYALQFLWLTFVQPGGMYSSGTLAFYSTFGFVPANFSTLDFDNWLNILSPLTYQFIHGSLLHVIINTLMLLAFGGGLEKWLGSRRLLILFFSCGLIAAAIHLAFDPFDHNPVIGASGATSGLFAAGLILLKRMGTGIGAGRYGLLPLIALWIVISVVFGMTGSPAGQSVAWMAHIGGFLGGFLVLWLMKKLN